MSKFDITKEQAIGIYLTQSNLARALGISRQAVSDWPNGKPIPEAQALKLRFILKPELFKVA